MGTTGGTLYSVNATTGHLNWSYSTGNELESDPVAADGAVYVTDTSGNLHCSGGKANAHSYPDDPDVKRRNVCPTPAAAVRGDHGGHQAKPAGPGVSTATAL